MTLIKFLTIILALFGTPIFVIIAAFAMLSFYSIEVDDFSSVRKLAILR